MIYVVTGFLLTGLNVIDGSGLGTLIKPILLTSILILMRRLISGLLLPYVVTMEFNNISIRLLIIQFSGLSVYTIIIK